MDDELIMGMLNRRLSGAETIFLMASTGKVHINSTMIRTLSSYNKRLPNFVPEEIEDEVYEKLFQHYKEEEILRDHHKH